MLLSKETEDFDVLSSKESVQENDTEEQKEGAPQNYIVCLVSDLGKIQAFLNVSCLIEQSGG